MENDNTHNPKYPVQTLEKALDVIEILAQSPSSGLGVTELNKKLEIGKSTIHRILDTLMAYGYVGKVPNTANYRLSWRLYEIGSIVPRQRDLGNFDPEILNELCNKYEETVNLGIRVNKHVVIISKVEPVTAALRANFLVGELEPLHATALGKVLLSEMKEDELQRILGTEPFTAYTSKTHVRLPDLIEDLYKIRAQGYAIDDQEFSLGLSCIALPVRNYKNEMVAAVSVSGPSVRLSFSKVLNIQEDLKIASIKLSKYLGYDDRI